MKRAPDLNYQAVADLCRELCSAGETPTIRKLREKLGGSFSTISAFLNQWQEQKILANQQAGLELSEPFREAMLAEFGG